MADEAPPLRVWIYPILAASAMALLFLSYCYSSYGPYGQVVALSNKNLEKALNEITRDSSTLSIVVLGSSLTEYALVDPKGIEDSIFQLTNKKTKMLRVALNFMDLDVAKRIDFFDYIKKYPPNYLFIENFSFNIDHGDTSATIPEPVNVALLQLRNYVRNAIGKEAHENYYTKWYTFDIKPTDEFYSSKFDSITFKSLLQSQNTLVRKVAQNSVANSAYEALMKKNTKVIFLDMPLHNQFPPNFLDQQSTSELNKVLKVYKTQYRIDYWQFPYVMDDSCYTDGAHFNSKGAMQFQKWFVSEFVSNRKYEATR